MLEADGCLANVIASKRMRPSGGLLPSTGVPGGVLPCVGVPTGTLSLGPGVRVSTTPQFQQVRVSTPPGNSTVVPHLQILRYPLRASPWRPPRAADEAGEGRRPEPVGEGLDAPVGDGLSELLVGEFLAGGVDANCVPLGGNSGGEGVRSDAGL